MKTCTKCGYEKDLDEFNNELKRKDGKYPWCKACLSEHRKERYEKTPRKVWIHQKVCSKCKQWKPREEFRKYKGNNLHYRCVSCEDIDADLESKGLTECSSCGEVKSLEDFYLSRLRKTSKQCRSCQKSYYAARDKEYIRDYNLRKKFGISINDYKELLAIQDHMCPICLVPFEEGNYSYPVDHAHAGPNAGVIRAILHDRCNRFVMGDNIDPFQLRRTADLIESPLTDWYVPEEQIKPKRRRKTRKASK